MKYSRILFAAFVLILAIFPHPGTSAQASIPIQPITSIAWSPDGTMIAVSGGALKCDPTDPSKFSVRIFNAATLQITKTLTGHTCPTTGIDWSPDGSKLVSASSNEGKAYVWDITSGQILASTSATNGIVTAVWQPNGNLIASVFSENTVIIWDSANGTLNTPTEFWGTSVDWSPDGTQLVTGSGYGTDVGIFDALSQQELRVLKGHTDGVGPVAWSPDGTKIASGSADKSIKIWNATTGVTLLTLQGHSESITALAWHPNSGVIASSSSDRTVRFWNIADGQSLDTIQAPQEVYAIAWSPDGRQLAYGGADNTLQIIPAPLLFPSMPPPGTKLESYITSVSPDGSMLAEIATGSRFRIWDTQHNTVLFEIPGLSVNPFSVAWNRDSTRIATAGGDDIIRIWCVDRSQVPACEPETLLKEIAAESGPLLSVSWNAQGILASSGQGIIGGIRTWDANNDYQALAFTPGDPDQIAWNPSGDRLALATKGGLFTVGANLATDPGVDFLLDQRIGAEIPTSSVAWKPDGTQIALGANDGSIYIFDYATKTEVKILRGHKGIVYGLTWNPDQIRLASTSEDGTIRIWDTTNDTAQIIPYPKKLAVTLQISWSLDGSKLYYGATDDGLQIIPAPQVQTPTPQPDTQTSNTQPDYPMPPFQLAYSPDGSMIAGSADRLLRVWDANTGATLITFPTIDTTYVLDVTWSPDSKRIATASDDQFVRVWNISDSKDTPGQLLQSIQPITAELGILTSVDWSPNGKLLAIGSASEPYSLRIWDATKYVQIRQIAAGWVERLDWNPASDSNAIIVSDDNGGTALVSDIGSPSNISFRHIGRNDPVSATVWNADGSQIAVGYTDGKIYIWDTATNTSLSNMDTGIEGRIYQLAWSPDNKQLASTNGNGIVQVWDTGTGKLITSLPGISASVDFSPDGTKLAYAAGAGAIQIVDTSQIFTPTPTLSPTPQPQP